MKLHKLTLRHWRGITDREIQFDEGVTLVEGPNETGKSSIIEAIQIIFSELDSSNKKQVKSIQPAGQDVGSEVRIEFSIGEHHIVYAKTYNKNKATTVQISGKQTLQETGRTAHERVAKLLEEQVDMTLWRTLLVDQGEQVNQINLNNSTSLAQALDNAAGAVDNPQLEDETLIDSVQREYEKYYTLKSGRIKFSNLVDARDQTTNRLAELKASITQIEQDQNQQKNAQQEVERLHTLFPQMQQAEQIQRQRWQTLQSKNAVLTTKRQHLADTENQLAHIGEAIQSRAGLIAQISSQQQSADQLTQQADTLRNKLLQENNTANTLNEGLTQLKDEEKNLRNLEKLARTDLNYLEKTEQLAGYNKTLLQSRSIQQDITEHLNIIAHIQVDASALDTYGQAEQKLAVAQAKAQMASTTLTLTAKQSMSVNVNDELLRLDPTRQHQISVSNRLTIGLPDLLDISVEPPESTTDLAVQLQEAESELTELQNRLGVSDIQAATALARQRADSEAQVQHLKSQQTALLKNLQTSDLEEQIALLTASCRQYVDSRLNATALPADTLVATDTLTHLEQKLTHLQEQIEKASEACQRQMTRVASSKQNLEQITQQQLAAKAAVDALTNTLDAQRKKRTDEAFTFLEAEHKTMVKRLQLEIEAVAGELADENVDAQKMLLENATSSAQRTAAELRQQEQALAILNDRLATARANGLHERMLETENQLLQLEQNLTATQRRAEAARRLWETINQHRDAARQAYLQPLKQRVEALGKLVFGHTFGIEIADDWSITHRILEQMALPFEDLSIGAKEQLAILMRLAAAQLVAGENGIPLFIDDALGFSDPQKLNDMGAAIAATGRTCQIIILTCVPGRYANVGNAKLIKLEP